MTTHKLEEDKGTGSIPREWGQPYEQLKTPIRVILQDEKMGEI